MARQDLPEEALYRFYERAGIYAAFMPAEEADKRAYMEIVKNER